MLFYKQAQTIKNVTTQSSTVYMCLDFSLAFKKNSFSSIRYLLSVQCCVFLMLFYKSLPARVNEIRIFDEA